MKTVFVLIKIYKPIKLQVSADQGITIMRDQCQSKMTIEEVKDGVLFLRDTLNHESCGTGHLYKLIKKSDKKIKLVLKHNQSKAYIRRLSIIQMGIMKLKLKYGRK